MRRPCRRPPVAEVRLAAHLRATLWGPAEFIGPPPWWLVGEGLLAGVLGAGLIVGAGAMGVWTGTPTLASGEAGLVLAAALALYLLITGAGRALVGVVAVLGVCLALLVPQVAAGAVLAHRGQVQSVVVTSVEAGPGSGRGHGRYLCSVADSDGAPLRTRIWRGCRQSTRPGDALTVVFDPEGHVPPRGLAAPGTERAALIGAGTLALALAAGSVIAVVRSFRLGPVRTSTSQRKTG
ncbi:hypothetical protein StrepF001_38815 [Streptomyces sp. F001]|uniref:hypothetical protein n=1 Tax=Streptomyces sp. F001 TaxID=1510026 RepID=UPI00101E50BF|nr:hypothetical protein [Streptomyces sp. F001]RZB14317.1 hypothetical protein StrepF001_38815 [Streptomyces sp. F001]